MPVHSRKIKGKWRLVEASGTIAKNKAGTAMDGGGHATLEGSNKQAQAVNIHMHEEGKI